MSDWVSIEERLPKQGESVIVSDGMNSYCARFQSEDRWGSLELGEDFYGEPFWIGSVTHWMPLPDPPSNS